MQERTRLVRKIVGGAVYDPLPINQFTKGMLYVLRTCLVHVATHTYLPHTLPLAKKTCHLRRNMYFDMYSDGGKTITDTLWFLMTAGYIYAGVFDVLGGGKA